MSFPDTGELLALPTPARAPESWMGREDEAAAIMLQAEYEGWRRQHGLEPTDDQARRLRSLQRDALALMPHMLGVDEER